MKALGYAVLHSLKITNNFSQCTPIPSPISIAIPILITSQYRLRLRSCWLD